MQLISSMSASSLLDLNPQFLRALECMEKSERNVFVTGRAGTGKSTLLSHFRDRAKKQVAVLAPTGVAALNVHGATIHSFFGFKPDITVEKAKKLAQSTRKRELYRKAQTIVIDEISMVRADLLDSVDAFLRAARGAKHLAFGGVQMIFIGDLYQLPPVVTSQDREAFLQHYTTPYFFSARAFEQFPMEFIELEKIYRQKDDAFIAILNAIRNNTATEAHLARLNARVNPAFEPPKGEFYITLAPTNDHARQINELRLAELPGKAHRFEGEISGEFDFKQLPTDMTLQVKREVQVMMVANDAGRRWVNGSVGRVLAVKKDAEAGEVIVVEFPGGRREEVTPHRWDIFSYEYNPGARALETRTVGSFTQYPLKLAWAVTIHKSQGKTFEKVVIDMGRGAFAHGQTYVALSRVTSLEGLVLKRPIVPGHIRVDWHVRDFITKYQYRIAEAKLSREEKIRMITEAIKNKTRLAIVYLKSRDEKSQRIILPRAIGEREYAGHPFTGVDAYCETRKEDRIFNVARILEIQAVVGAKQSHTS